MDVNAMDGTYVDYVENVPALGKEPNALADHTDQEVDDKPTVEQMATALRLALDSDRNDPARRALYKALQDFKKGTALAKDDADDDGPAAAITRVRGVVKDLIDAGNTYWAREILTALEPGSVDDHG